jgi:hypothetical protein
LRNYASSTKRGIEPKFPERSYLTKQELDDHAISEPMQGEEERDKLALLERWTDQGALDAHARLQSTRPPLRPELRAGNPEREDYAYNRTR